MKPRGVKKEARRSSTRTNYDTLITMGVGSNDTFVYTSRTEL